MQGLLPAVSILIVRVDGGYDSHQLPKIFTVDGEH
jgi:hypothetical protein